MNIPVEWSIGSVLGSWGDSRGQTHEIHERIFECEQVLLLTKVQIDSVRFANANNDNSHVL